jgi:hypothetical protein
MKRLEIRLPDEYAQILDDYCVKTGASKTGAIKMLISILKDEKLLAVVRKHLV